MNQSAVANELIHGAYVLSLQNIPEVLQGLESVGGLGAWRCGESGPLERAPRPGAPRRTLPHASPHLAVPEPRYCGVFRLSRVSTRTFPHGPALVTRAVCSWSRLAGLPLRVFVPVFVRDVALWFPLPVVSLSAFGLRVMLAS